MAVVNIREAKKVCDVFHALFNGCCPNDNSLLEKLRTWLETSLHDAGSVVHLISLSCEQTTLDLDHRNIKNTYRVIL